MSELEHGKEAENQQHFQSLEPRVGEVISNERLDEFHDAARRVDFKFTAWATSLPGSLNFDVLNEAQDLANELKRRFTADG